MGAPNRGLLRLKFVKTRLALLSACISFLTACSAPPPITGCTPDNGVTPYCYFKNPEDAVLLPNGQLIVSQMGDIQTGSPGALVLFDVEKNLVSPLFGEGHGPANRNNNDNWGEASCQDNPRDFLSPHGIDLLKREDDRWQLVVVNHGRRESVELFEILIDQDNVAALWRGCVKAPNKEFFNDVAALADGGFIASNMYSTRGPKFFGMPFGALKPMLGMNSGYLLEWHPGGDPMVVPGSEGRLPNGLALSADGRFIFQNLYGDNEVRKLDRQSGQILASTPVTKPDNTSFDKQGRLLVASQKVSMLALMSCMKEPERPCPRPFEIVRIDPATMSASVVVAHEGPPMGMGTVAVQRQDKLFIGSFVGDRMIAVPYSAEEQ